MQCNTVETCTCIMEIFKAWISNAACASYAEPGRVLNRIREHSVAAHVLHLSSGKVEKYYFKEYYFDSFHNEGYGFELFDVFLMVYAVLHLL